jgi:hypothetical protein
MAKEQQRGNLDDYLKGKPMTADLARLAAGEDEDEPEAPANVVQMRGPQMARPGNFQPDDDDREHLRRLLLEPGWPILLKLLDRRLQLQEDAAKAATKINPFAPENAAQWAAVAALERVRHEMVTLAESEVAMLDRHEED